MLRNIVFFYLNKKIRELKSPKLATLLAYVSGNPSNVLYVIFILFSLSIFVSVLISYKSLVLFIIANAIKTITKVF